MQFATLALHSLGVIYGDIGTSPLYVYNTVFVSPPSGNFVTLFIFFFCLLSSSTLLLVVHHVTYLEIDALGCCSAVIWALILIVTFKYCVIVLNAGFKGTMQDGLLLLLLLLLF